mmetsp:Transcript_48450/g.58454  ORF Transcript_48450/g.58454 Transcript_48450/m.58454 type:complete len:486 (+) Transcript_48450:144-1601(+)
MSNAASSIAAKTNNGDDLKDEPEQENASYHVAIIGGGISGCTAASILLQTPGNTQLHVELFDQGRNGVGGRSSHRIAWNENPSESAPERRFDHGCQFFRADTERFHSVVQQWIEDGFAEEWNGRFDRPKSEEASSRNDFFGFSNDAPIYVGVGGMQSVTKGLLSQLQDSPGTFALHPGTRVSGMERDGKKWRLVGEAGDAAYHDTSVSQFCAAGGVGHTHTPQPSSNYLGTSSAGYDAVILTDISSSFESWHRASAGVPPEFASLVRNRAGSRVPLFSAMVSFESPLPVEVDAISLTDNPVLWFAARSASKPGIAQEEECWTLVSTPEYALSQIQETPMQDDDGNFLPQTPQYLTTIPGPHLEQAFREHVTSIIEVTQQQQQPLPKTTYLNAQRWGSGIPSHRHLDESSPTRAVVSGVPYDVGRAPLAPTRVENVRSGPTPDNFLYHEGFNLYQAGDMMSVYTPGFEGAALSGMDAATHLLRNLP